MEMRKKIRVIITGATGMVGEGVLHLCLRDVDVETVLIINRKKSGISHPKLKEIVHNNFSDFSSIQQEFRGYNACFFCLGISSVGVNNDDYYKVTYELTMRFAEAVSKENEGMTFCYVSGAGTNKNGWQKWAQVKAKTETDLQKLPFKKAYGLRPGFIKPIPNLQHTHSFYKYINWAFPLGRKLYPNGFCTMEELANCMMELAQNGYEKTILEGTDIITVADRRTNV